MTKIVFESSSNGFLTVFILLDNLAYEINIEKSKILSIGSINFKYNYYEHY